MGISQIESSNPSDSEWPFSLNHNTQIRIPTSSATPPTCKETPEDSLLLKLYKPILTGLFCVGYFPLTLTVTKGYTPQFNFRLFSLKTFYTVLLHLFLYHLLLGRLVSTNTGDFTFSNKGPQNGTEEDVDPGIKTIVSIGYVMISIYSKYMIPTTAILSMILQTSSCRPLTTFILNWKPFETDFNEAFGSHKKPFNSLGRIRAKILLYYSLFGIIPLLLSIGGLLITVLVGMFSLESIQPICTIIVKQIPGLVIRDGYFVFLFMTIVVAYREVNLAIGSSPEVKCSHEDVQKWSRLVHTIRAQVTQGERVLGAMGIFDVSILSYSLLASLFLTYDCYSKYGADGTQFRTVLALLSLSLWYTVRIGIKTAVADKIKHEAKQLSETLFLKSGNHSDHSARLEMKFIIDFITESSSGIRFGNLLYFEKGLVLKIFSTVLTYLVVLIQFDSSISITSRA